jgi:hypothetical protein
LVGEQIGKKGRKSFNSETWGKILVVDFREHYNHKGNKLVDSNIRVASPLGAGRNVSFEKRQLKDGATWINRR